MTKIKTIKLAVNSLFVYTHLKIKVFLKNVLQVIKSQTFRLFFHFIEIFFFSSGSFLASTQK